MDTECLELFGVAQNIVTLWVNSMEKWRVMLCAGDSKLGEVDFKRGMFQGDGSSPLVFVLALTKLSLILRKANAAYQCSTYVSEVLSWKFILLLPHIVQKISHAHRTISFSQLLKTNFLYETIVSQAQAAFFYRIQH